MLIIARYRTESQLTPFTERHHMDFLMAWRYMCAWLVRLTHTERIEQAANAEVEEKASPPIKTRRSEPSIPYWQKMNARWMNRYARRMANNRKKTKRVWRGW